MHGQNHIKFYVMLALITIIFNKTSEESSVVLKHDIYKLQIILGEFVCFRRVLEVFIIGS